MIPSSLVLSRTTCEEKLCTNLKSAQTIWKIHFLMFTHLSHNPSRYESLSALKSTELHHWTGFGQTKLQQFKEKKKGYVISGLASKQDHGRAL